MGICPPNYAHRMDPEWLGMKTVGKTPKLFSQPYFLTGKDQKRECRTEKQNRYYGIFGTEEFDREYDDYDRESGTQDGNIHVSTWNIKLEKIIPTMHKLHTNKRHNQTFKQVMWNNAQSHGNKIQISIIQRSNGKQTD